MARGEDRWGAVLARFDRVRRAGPGRWRASCPVWSGHRNGDRNPSLSLWVGRRGQLLVGCWRGCSKADILAAVGLEMRDLFDNEDRQSISRAGDAPKRRIVAVYDYEDEDAHLLYQKVRFEPKGFCQRVPDERYKGGWRWQLGDVRRVLYRLPELTINTSRPVIVCEGEKDADAVAALDLVATTNTEGAGHAMSESQKWRDEYSDTLRGRRVVILPDNDGPGWARAYYVAGSLLVRGAASVRVVAVPAPCKDVGDWLLGGGTREALCDLIRRTPEWRTDAGRVAG